jgi:hypothetical protein
MTAFEAFEYEEPRETHEWEQPEVHESPEMELAQELLEVTSEEELEEFLGKLVRSVARGASSFMKSGVGRAVGGVLRSVAKTALPMVGSALGTFVAPGIGTAIGGQLGSMASKLLETEELESMGEEEAEFEAARRYVRWASGTVRTAMRAPRGTPPRLVARSAAVASARRHAPALVRSTSGAQTSSWRGRRGPGWGTGGPAPYRGRRRGCTCGRRADWDTDDGNDSWDPANGDDDRQAPDAMESHEAHEVSGSAGRWYRGRNGIVIVGA